MKQKIATLLALTAFAAIVFAQPAHPVNFGWTASPSTDVASYNFYDTTSPGTNVLLGNTTNLTFSLTNWDYTTQHSYAVTAVDTNGLESGLSTPLVIPALPAPGNLRITQ